MKKLIIVLFIISSIYLFNNSNGIIIPANAIRFRIIANSNSINDQALKNTIKDDLINNVFSLITINNNPKEELQNKMPLVKETLDRYNINYDISLGNNYFPKKTYKGIIYPEGYYESLVITLDNGLGNNYWCVLYPPLCLVENQNNTNNIEYKSLIKEIINNYR